MPRFLRSTSLRLALGYAVLFALSSFVLVAFLWWRTVVLLDRRNDAEILASSHQIAGQLRDFGLPGAIDAINDRVAGAADPRTVLLLADGARKPVAGNLPEWPHQVSGKTGWTWAELAVGGGLHEARLLHTVLPNGYNLLIGRDVEGRVEVRSLIIEALGWALASTLLLAVGGALALRHAVLRRVAMINEAATAIVHGELGRRVPTRDTADAFDQLAQTINLLLYQIQQLIEGVRSASNAVAHDLRTPLAELRARLEELTLLRPSSDAMFEEVQKAVADIDRLIAVFNALLRLAEIDSGVRRSGFRRVDLGLLAIEVAELYAPLAEEKRGAIIVDAQSGLAVNGDRHLLAQAVGNLVDNAVKYLPCGGTVALRVAAQPSGGARITVADNGPGIPEAEKDRVTQRFYRCTNSESQVGLGLGLSVVEAVARLHEGRLVLADNHPGLRAELELSAPAF